MSSSTALEVSGLSKEYVIGEQRGGYSTVRDAVAHTYSTVVRGEHRPRPRRHRIWALDDVSFQLEQGEALGVIGHNGAGKTTILKILSRITAPTKGEVRVKGHVGSLLEVGTGFHPELTGRDNVYLNGAILGMHRNEIKRKFDEIVSFAEIEQFIDTPVKRYSSGMYVRLAFAVAAHLEPDILIVDEVLAVGDAAFQRKCLGKMGDASYEGRTVLFVSHNMGAVRALTRRAIWLDHGHLIADGETATIVSDYLASTEAGEGAPVADLRDDSVRHGVNKPMAHKVRFESAALLGPTGDAVVRLPERAPLRVKVTFRVVEAIRFLELYLRVKTLDGRWLFSSFSGQREAVVDAGTYTTVCEFPDNPLAPGSFAIELIARGIENQDLVPNAVRFEVDPVAEGDIRYAVNRLGLIRLDSEWSEIQRAARELVDDAAIT
jgi:lipopolysaccharide transport system ATP-binding protein